LSPVVLAISLLGFAGLGGGAAALWANLRGAAPRLSPGAWRAAQLISVAAGVVFGLLSAALTFSMGYPVETADGNGRVVGIPFFVAYIDRLGQEYLSSLSLAGLIGNGVFWFLVPKVVVFLWAERRRLPRT